MAYELYGVLTGVVSLNTGESCPSIWRWMWIFSWECCHSFIQGHIWCPLSL